MNAMKREKQRKRWKSFSGRVKRFVYSEAGCRLVWSLAILLWGIQIGLWVKWGLERHERAEEERMSVATVASASGDGGAGKVYGEALAAGEEACADLSNRLRSMAKAGDASAWTWLGLCHELGIGVDADGKEAFKCYRRAAKSGDGKGAVLLGWAYWEGVGTRTNAVRAKRWWRTAWEKDALEAAFPLAAYTQGREAAVWTMRILEKTTSLTLQESAFFRRQHQLARDGLRGDAAAQLKLGLWLAENRFEIDVDARGDVSPAWLAIRGNAAKWMKVKSASLDGRVLLDDLIDRGALTDTKAWMCLETTLWEGNMAEWWQTRADRKPAGVDTSGFSMRDWVKCLLETERGPMNPYGYYGMPGEEALRLMEDLAESGSMWAMNALIGAAEVRLGGERNGLEEARWLWESSLFAHSKYRLGCLCASEGNRVGRNPERAADWFAKCRDEDAGADGDAANNAVLLDWLRGENIFWVDATAEPGRWQALGELLAARARTVAERNGDFFAAILLAAKALREERPEEAKAWVEKAKPELNAALLEAWDGTVGGTEAAGTMVAGARALLGAGGKPDFRVALDAFEKAAEEGDAAARRLAFALLDCEWWGGGNPSRAMESGKAGALAGDTWLADEVAWKIWRDEGVWQREEDWETELRPWVERCGAGESVQQWNDRMKQERLFRETWCALLDEPVAREHAEAMETLWSAHEKWWRRFPVEITDAGKSAPIDSGDMRYDAEE